VGGGGLLGLKELKERNGPDFKAVEVRLVKKMMMALLSKVRSNFKQFGLVYILDGCVGGQMPADARDNVGSTREKDGRGKE
jgi:hypothetical protein